jgi:hypothetical protein
VHLSVYEELLKWGFPEDVWFHVDRMSSAHVYLRRPQNMSMEEIPEDLIADCAQLVKANSIMGCKTNNITVVYTEFENLKKTQRMEVGQVGFHDDKRVLTVKVEKKLSEVVNRLNKTREERKPNLQEEREERDRQERAERRKRDDEMRQQEKEEIERKKKEAQERSYSSIMQEDMMKTNEFSEDVDYHSIEDDFM